MEFEHEDSGPDEFWDRAGRYAGTVPEDESFTGEMAYMLVTLHRTGA
jgi:hypothetical protein